MTTAAELEWVAARDGSRTARIQGRWLAGCSVPKRSAEMMLRKLTVRGNVACLLLPNHAQQIVACLDKLDPATALIAILADPATADLMRQCYDFAPVLAAGRLFLATDEASLRAVFAQHPGLPIPQQFIRLPVTPQADSDLAIAWAQRVFSDVGAQQAQRSAAARSAWKKTSDHLCIVVSRRFRLWDDAGDTLARCLAGNAGNEDNAPDIINVDDPRQSASAHVATRSLAAAAIVTANAGRADQRELISPHQPWITWITQPRIPAFVPTSPRDGLLVAEESFVPLALQANWPRDRVRVAGAPPIIRPAAPAASGVPALLADIPDLAPPAEIQDYSSWRVIWDAVRKDLIDHPHRLAGDIDGYLEKARRHFGVPAEGFPSATFIDRLIGPAYVIGIARWLAKENIHFTLHGRGWDRVENVAGPWQGPVTDRDSFEAITSAATALVNPFLAPSHAASGTGLPIIRTAGRTPQRILQELRSPSAFRMPVSPAPLHAGLLHELFR